MQFALVGLLIFGLTLFPRGFGHAQNSYTLQDVRGETKACTTASKPAVSLAPTCQVQEEKSLTTISNSMRKLDSALAQTEIKKNIKKLAEAQIANSLIHLQKVGVASTDVTLSSRLQKLKEQGYKINQTFTSEEADLSEKYLIASLRYNELRKQSGNAYLNEQDRNQIQERLELLEARYPLLAGHSFSKLSTNASAILKTTSFIPKETSEESLILDNFLFNGTPKKVSQIDMSDINATSSIGQITKAYSGNTNPRIKDSLRSILNQDLQASLSDQLGALAKLSEFNSCETLTLHSKVTLFAIQSSVHPNEVFADLCKCKQANAPVPESTLLVSGLVAGAAGLLCVAPTGIGQLIACPTAAAAGWATTGGSAINLGSQLSRYGSYDNQGGVLQVLESGQDNKTELTLLSKKQSELTRDVVNSNMMGLVGFSVGHVGFSKLSQIYVKSKVTKNLNELSATQRKDIDSAFSSLNKEDQTRAFLVLDKLDEESRKILLQKPELLNQQMKGLRCEI